MSIEQTACKIWREAAVYSMQQLVRDWEGAQVEPPISFSMQLEEEELVMRAQREAPANVQPGSQGGVFTPLLWKYDVAEFFLRGKGVKPYMEINLAPNGAWWAAVFDDPRVDHPGFALGSRAALTSGHTARAGMDSGGFARKCLRGIAAKGRLLPLRIHQYADLREAGLPPTVVLAAGADSELKFGHLAFLASMRKVNGAVGKPFPFTKFGVRKVPHA